MRKTMIKPAALFSLLFSHLVMASDLMWVEIGAWYKYKDVTRTCSNHYSAVPTYLSLEVSDDNPLIGYLHKMPSWPNERKLKLSTEELAGITVHRDAGDRIWVQQIQLSPRMLDWLLKKTTFTNTNCLKIPLTTIEGDSDFEYDLEGIDTIVKTVLTKSHSLSGQLKDGKQYSVRLNLTQKQHALEIGGIR